MDAEIRTLRYVQRYPGGAQLPGIPGAVPLGSQPLGGPSAIAMPGSLLKSMHAPDLSAQEALEREARLELRIRQLEREQIESAGRAQQALEQLQEHSAHAQAAALKEQQERLDALWAGRISGIAAAFGSARHQYFLEVETQVVRLALAIAARVLHREAQIDPLLLRGPVRVALEELQQQTICVLEVPAESAEAWTRWLAGGEAGSARVEVRAAEGVAADHCRLEIEASAADLSASAQLAEIERGFFDLLQHRPPVAVAIQP